MDDEKSNIDVLNHILKDFYTIFVAKNGRNAITVARERVPELILLDIVMPDMSGFEVLAELKANEQTQAIPVIFITGLDSIIDEEKGFGMGAVDYITKPFHHSIVKARVQTHLKIVEQMRKIENMGMIDELTGLPNRRSFNKVLEREWVHSIREGLPLSLLMIDVDRFKIYNDTYGHPQGDTLLQMIAGIFNHSLKRSTDFAARWGGEEFAILTPGTGIDGAGEVAEYIRSAVESTPIPRTDGSITHATISIGINCETPSFTDSSPLFVSRADIALYNAKESGRNKICVYSRE